MRPGPSNVKSSRPRSNEQIKVHYVRVVGADKNQIGILPTREAIGLARRQGLDLVEVAPQADPPVCRIMDFGKYIYEQKVKEKESKRKQHTTSVRYMRFSMKINENDYQVKLRKMREFLSERDRVKVTLPLRGREILHKNLGVKIFERIAADIDDIGAMESPPHVEGESRPRFEAMYIPKSQGS